ncbi:MAG: hypothetical protein ABJF10_18085 [Chthoniobacter sp.]|uniref:hypothetical protein n=1 Tax=Chthoniobacter sp. TaxID=2510640 RepID=UPI0032A4ED41
MKALLLLAAGTLSTALAWPVLKKAASSDNPPAQAIVNNLKSLMMVNKGDDQNQDAANKIAAAAVQSSMPEENLRRNLGEPVRIFRNESAQTVYYYPTVYIVISNGRCIRSIPAMINGVDQSSLAIVGSKAIRTLPVGDGTHVLVQTTDLQPTAIATPVPTAAANAFLQRSGSTSFSTAAALSHSTSGSARVWNSAPRASVSYSTQSNSKWQH